MDAETHTFPVPDLEVHKLDDLQHEIEGQQRYARAVRDFVSTHHWPLLGIATVTGVALALFFRGRR